MRGYCTNERRVRKLDKKVRCDSRQQQNMEREVGAAMMCYERLPHARGCNRKRYDLMSPTVDRPTQRTAYYNDKLQCVALTQS